MAKNSYDMDESRNSQSNSQNDGQNGTGSNQDNTQSKSQNGTGKNSSKNCGGKSSR